MSCNTWKIVMMESMVNNQNKRNEVFKEGQLHCRLLIECFSLFDSSIYNKVLLH